MNFFHSIKFRFTVWYLLVLAVLLAAVSVGVYFNVSRSLRDDLDDSLKIRAAELQGTRGIVTSIQQGLFQEELGEVVQVYFPAGDGFVTLKTRGAGAEVGSVIINRALVGERPFVTGEMEDGREMRFHVVPLFSEIPFSGWPGGPSRAQGGVISPSGQSPSGALVVGRSTEDIDDSLNSLMWTLAIVAPLALVVAGGGGVFLASRALKPVDRIARTALEIEESGDLGRRIKVKTKDELGRLSSILNRMIGRLEGAFNRQKEFTADASHELRAPLAVIQAEATLALSKDRTAEQYKEALETIARESANMAVLTDQLLDLARADADRDQHPFERIDLAELLQEVLSDAQTLGREKGVIIKADDLKGLMVRGDHFKLKRLFLNLLDNAVRYTPAGGEVTLSLGSEEKMARVSIADTGIGIAPEHIPHIFDRFYRVDKARSRARGGTGLGLAICKQIAESHGGSIDVTSSAGKGSTFRVLIPLA